MHEPPADNPIPEPHHGQESDDDVTGADGERTPVGEGFDLDTIWAMLQASDERSRGDALLGRQLGGVTLVRLVGEGGMARVYEGRQTFPARTVAVKVQRPERIDADHSRRFLRELEILAGLQHPGICRVHTAGILEEGSARSVWFVMDLVPDAAPITEDAARRTLSLRDRVGLFAEVCDAVAAGHARGIAHRDLKPRNILVGSDGRPKVIDFGVARATGTLPFATALTHTGQLVGTLQYMAPEVVDGPGQGDERGDVWALGVVLHELLVGEAPFEATEVPLPVAIDRIRKFKPALESRTEPGLPAALAAVVDRCLDPEPLRRYPDAGSLAAAIRAIAPLEGRWDATTIPLSARGGAAGSRQSPGRTPLSRRSLVALGAIARIAPLEGRWDATTIPLSARGGAAGSRQSPGRTPLSRRSLVALGATAIGVLPVVALLRTRRPRPPGLPAAAPIQNPSPDGSDGPMPPSYQLRSSPIERPDYSFHFGTVFRPGADAPIVERFNARRLQEPFYLRDSYWCTEKDDVVASLVWKFEFPGPTTRVFLAAGASCYDYRRIHNGEQRGTSALDLSTDGGDWTTLRDDLDRDVWGEEWTIDELLPDSLLGSTSLWLRVRMLTLDTNPNANYSLAQFCRAPETVSGDTFRLDAECRR